MTPAAARFPTRLPVRPAAFVFLILSWAIAGCASRRPVARAPVPSPPPATAPPSTPPAPVNPPPRVPAGTYSEEGVASWYGEPFNGRRAANGEIYDMQKMTAAHRTLPFDSIVRVTNLINGRTAEVRINDRGPFVEKRIIDLSLAAARTLGIDLVGVAPVRLELLAGTNPRDGNFTVQVGAFIGKENANRVRARLELRYDHVFIHMFDSPSGVFYRVWVGQEPTQEAARRLAARLASEENFTPFVVRLDP